MKTQSKKILPALVLSYLTVLGLGVDLRLPKSEENAILQVLKSLGGFSITQIILLIGIIVLYTCAILYIKKNQWTLRDKICVATPAAMFSLFMIVGYSFRQTDSLDLILINGVQKVKAGFAFAGYFIVFFVLIACLYTWLPEQSLLQSEDLTLRKNGFLFQYKQVLLRAPFWTTLVTLLVLYLPYMILSYPAILMGDTDNQIAQGFNFPEWTSDYVNLIDENVLLNGHHPVVHTMLIHVCLVLGKAVFNSYNVGIFLVSIMQIVAVCSVCALSIKKLNESRVHENILIGIVGYVAFAPRIQTYMFLITKDVLAAVMLLLFLLSLFDILHGESGQRKNSIALVLSGIGMGLLRNDGKYIILGSIMFTLLLRKKSRPKMLRAGMMIALVFVLFFNVAMPALHITHGSQREALSVPFQQTARYYRDYSKEVTEEEERIISAVLRTEGIGEKYRPETSDPVKGEFNKEATGEDLKAYFKVWFQMGLKHPGVYVQATLNNYYNYFYPGAKLAKLGNMGSYSWSEHYMEVVRNHKNLKEIGLSIQYPERLSKMRTAYENLREKVFELPVLSILKSPAAFVWTLILLAFYLLKEKAWTGLAQTIPLILSVGICFLSPRNGDYFRYLYGVSLCLPVVIICALLLCGHREEESI